ncbi:MAG: Prolipoprotein diacylglyceryl transferase [Gemmatimonadetes bacterium]|nr:Prolipoprotein diacylglyceryl transferase [Gemmatimonadota bacterium]
MTTHPIIHHPLALGVGPLQLTGFGIAMLLSFIIAQVVAQHLLRRRGHDPEPVADMIIAAVIGGLLGAKLYFVVVLHNYDALFTRGGFVFWGGLIGGAVAVMLVVRHKKLPQARIADVSGPALAAAYAVGRTGCWAVGDDYGRPWNGFLAVAFPDGAPPSTVRAMSRDFGVQFPAGLDPASVVGVHPTQLYEVALAIGMFLVLWRLRDHRHREGWLMGAYCVLAGAERFGVEFFRAKDDRLFGPLTWAQLIALAFVAGGAVLMRVRAGRSGLLPLHVEA